MNDVDLAEAANRPVTSTPQVRFYIAATSSLLERRPRTLKHGDTFGLFDHYGDVVPHEGSPEGLYHRDTRYLSGFQLLINDRRPLLLSSTIQDNNAYLTADLTNPDFFEDGRLNLARDTIHINRSKLLWQAQAHERLAIRNFNDRTHHIRLTFLFESDFADLFEVRGHRRPARGRKSARTRTAHAVVLTYRGLAANTWHTTIEFAPAPEVIRHDRAVFGLTLEPGERRSLFVTVTCTRPKLREPRPERFFVCARGTPDLRRTAARAAAVVTSNEIFNEVLCRSMADLVMLTTDTAYGPYPYAGIPWFSTAFGRDGMITAAQLLWLDPAIAKGVLRFLAATQATELQPAAEAEPGKTGRDPAGEMAQLGEVPFGLDYGAVDSTPLFVMLAGMYFERTGDLATIREIWPNLQAALRWIDDYGDRDGDGFVEYQSQTEGGLSNQGWRIRRILCSTPTAASRRAPSPFVRCRATSTQRSIMPRSWRPRWGSRPWLMGSTPKRPRSRNASRRRFGARTSRPTPWRLTATSSPAGFGPRMLAKCFFLASQTPTVRPRWQMASWTTIASAAGASAPSRGQRPATIPCPTTTARSGPTTTL